MGSTAATSRRGASACASTRDRRDGDVAYLKVLQALIEYNFEEQHAAIGSESFRRRAEKLGAQTRLTCRPCRSTGAVRASR